MAWPSVSRGGRLPVLGTPVPPSLCSALPRPLVSPPASPPPPSHPSIISPPPRFPVSPSCVLLPTIQCPPQPPVPTSPRPPPPSPVPPLPFPPSSILRPHVHPLPPPFPRTSFPPRRRSLSLCPRRSLPAPWPILRPPLRRTWGSEGRPAGEGTSWSLCGEALDFSQVLGLC